jgi:hypothetical protein
MTAEPCRFFDVVAAAEFLQARDITATKSTIRTAIASGGLEYKKIGKKFFTSETWLMDWLARSDRKRPAAALPPRLSVRLRKSGGRP